MCEQGLPSYLCLAFDLWRLMRVDGRYLESKHKCTTSAREKKQGLKNSKRQVSIDEERGIFFLH